MRKLMIAAVAAAALTGVSAQGASAADGLQGPCAKVADTFADANIHRDPLPEPLESTAGTAYRTVCKVTG
jgi:hypothetical protein